MKEWTILDRQTVLASKWITVYRDRVRLENETVIDDYYTVRQANAVGIVAIDRDGCAILKEEYRHAAGKCMIELPAGMIERDERDPLETAKRELAEETGYRSDNWEYLGRAYADAARLNTYMELYLERDCVKGGAANPEATEVIQTVRMPWDRSIEAVLRNEITCSTTAHAILMADRLLAKEK